MKKFILILALTLAGCASMPSENIHIGVQYSTYTHMDSWGMWQHDFYPHHYGHLYPYGHYMRHRLWYGQH